MDEHNELQALRQEVANLATELATLREAYDAVPQRNDDPMPGNDIAEAVTRRNWMKAAAAAAVGGTAVALTSAERVAAADGDPLEVGVTTNTASSRTAIDHSGDDGDVSFLFRSQSPFGGSRAQFPSVLAGWTGASSRPTGIYGYTGVATGDANGVVGVTTSPQGAGVFGRNEAAGAGVVGEGSASGVGVSGKGKTGVAATGAEFGLVASGVVGAIFIPPTNAIAPKDRTETASPGAIDTQRTDDELGTSNLWFCVNGGAGGDWRKLAGDDTAGSLHPITPTRVYDSRALEPLSGKLATGADRTLSVANGRDLTTGAVAVADLVPEGARAVAYNLTVSQTENSGFLSINPGGTAAFAASSINWSTSGQALANGGIVGLDFSRQVTVFCGGGGATHFIVDVTGYYL